MSWVGIDLDGTLMHTQSPGYPYGEPVQAILDIVRGHVAEGKEVRIFTARVSNGGEHWIPEIQDWLERIGLPRLAVTCIKDQWMDLLYDDKAVQVEFNTGRLGRLP